jgi:hypothetical protein
MNYNKVIFLDIDGVLAVSKDSDIEKELFLAGIYYPFNPECVNILNTIITNSEAEIILSSDWRITLNLDKLNEIFIKNNVIKSPKDITPIGLEHRGLEIKTFLKYYSTKKFVILDDMDIEGFDNNFIKVNYKTGLTEKLLPKILNKL